MIKKPYLRDRWIQTHPDNFYIITPQEFEVEIPLSCPVCKTLMRSRDDEIAWTGFNCCHRCYLTWASPRREQWKEGWRPDPYLLDQEIKQRPPIAVKFEVD
jgi:hypothetical protein